MRIVVVSAGSPLRRGSWSGIPFYIHRELTRRYGDVHAVANPLLDRLLHLLSRAGLATPREPLLARLAAALVGAQIEKIRPALVVCVNAPHKVVDLPPKWPIVLVEDAAFDTMIRYYPRYGRLPPRQRAVGHALQQRIIERCAAVLLSSPWAAHEAAGIYGRPASAFTVARMGANLDEDPGPPPPRGRGQGLKLLFVGYEWTRKGGPLVLETYLRLRERLGAVALHIVGCSPAIPAEAAGVVVHGRLDKDDPADAAKLAELYRTASLFFMPSRQEAFGIVYCEALAFGLPVVATDTGGVGAIVQHGVNGLLLPARALAADYADGIEALWRDGALYARMQAAARRSYLQNLNWRAWGDVFDTAAGAALPTAT